MRIQDFLLISHFVTLAACAEAQPAQRTQPPPQPRFWGFAAPWDAASDASIRAHGHRLDAIVSGWIGLDSASGRPLLPSPYVDSVRPISRNNAGPKLMSIVTSWHGDQFHQKSIRTLASDATKRAAAAGAIARHAQSMRYTGLVLDFETLERADLAAQLTVMRAIADSARAHGVTMIAAAVPATDTVAYPAKALLGVVDAIIPMLYDEHWAGSKPGPVASPQWVRASLALRVAEAGAARVIAGLPTYGYRWIQGQPTEAVGFVEAQGVAAGAGVPLTRDSTTLTLRARTSDWDMWVADAALLRTLVRAAGEAGVSRVALWRLGREDPAVWRELIR